MMLFPVSFPLILIPHFADILCLSAISGCLIDTTLLQLFFSLHSTCTSLHMTCAFRPHHVCDHQGRTPSLVVPRSLKLEGSDATGKAGQQVKEEEDREDLEDDSVEDDLAWKPSQVQDLRLIQLKPDRQHQQGEGRGGHVSHGGAEGSGMMRARGGDMMEELEEDEGEKITRRCEMNVDVRHLTVKVEDEEEEEETNAIAAALTGSVAASARHPRPASSLHSLLPALPTTSIAWRGDGGPTVSRCVITHSHYVGCLVELNP